MILFVPPAIEQYAHDHTTDRGALFDALREHTQAHVPMPQMQVGRVEGTLLKLLAGLMGARRILEIGTYTGYSALCMAEALPDGGRLITCDRSEEFTQVARDHWRQSPHGSKIELRLGDALDTVEALDDEPFDMAFVDADKSRYPKYYEAILPRIRPGGLLAIDNTLWSGQVLDPQSEDAKGIAAVNDIIQADERVENVLLTVRYCLILARKR